MTETKNGEHKRSRWRTAVASTRYIMALAVAATFFGATVLLLTAITDMFSAVWQVIVDKKALEEPLRLVMIESIDTVLVSTVLYVIAIGLYQLFVDPLLHSRLPAWLRIEDVGELENRLAGMVVTVLGVLFVSKALEWDGTEALLYFGLAVGAVIAAISFFLYQEGKHASKFPEMPDDK